MTDDTAAGPTPNPPTPFHDLDDYIALGRLGGLALSRDGTRLVTTVQTLDPERTGYVSALWEVDPTGSAPARRLTRSAKGESSAAFTADGDLLFTSARPDPDATADAGEPRSALWLLPPGGEARPVATAPGGLGGILTARDADVVSVAAPLLPSAADLEADAALRKTRKDRTVNAIWHTGYPVRHWDHDLGPDADRRFATSLAGLGESERAELRGLTGPGRQLDEHEAALSPDGATLVTTWGVADPGAARRTILVAVDTATGERRTLVDDPDAEVAGPVVSPDGRHVAYVTETITSPDEAPVVRTGLVALDGSGEPEVVADDWDRWPSALTWLPDSSGLLVTADDDGRGPVFLLTLDGGSGRGPVTVEQVTADDATFTDVAVAPDGAALYALRTSYAAPSEPVRVDLAAFVASGAPGEREPVPAVVLPSPVAAPELPGTLTEVETTASDGTRVRAWLALPADASPSDPAPLLLWIHGGPLGSWNAWSWRWNPWLMVARGYAVLLPDPALSTGYGQEFVQRGWGAWGDAPYTDLLAITDAAEAREEIDATRTAAMGGSFGGYMANWVAGHTDRFRAIVTHASLWALDQFGPTTDAAWYWAREMTAEMAAANSPHRFVGQIRTPMLVVHGDKDYRVPIGEGLRLWRELLSDSGLPAADDGTTVHRFLYFPEENHWVLTPQHAKVWYAGVLAFLAEHVLEVPAGEGDTVLPEVLG
ncbi:S9 family peptidase [Isoptericola aurantiacus]|uniref:S9 family peptidase n=1 Tax=Isoptericola aurantiacus TaxID=3377839 RepID=UPI00383B8AFB